MQSKNKFRIHLLSQQYLQYIETAYFLSKRCFQKIKLIKHITYLNILFPNSIFLYKSRQGGSGHYHSHQFVIQMCHANLEYICHISKAMDKLSLFTCINNITALLAKKPTKKELIFITHFKNRSRYLNTCEIHFTFVGKNIKLAVYQFFFVKSTEMAICIVCLVT